MPPREASVFQRRVLEGEAGSQRRTGQEGGRRAPGGGLASAHRLGVRHQARRGFRPAKASRRVAGRFRKKCRSTGPKGVCGRKRSIRWKTAPRAGNCWRCD
ncbi:hypothetical protein CCC_01452 [Paramagnetospirillum magnetotacticum MS-1]|uniref:Uncharacterized protein n=1 Tax=Paramagnetospirillum magnetotacticum MS-1 TaxID=272627 RepID=A0A0C2YB27_PARME|nr:hypothetical protein CCC_01452 [Paramagnetospirillum magnetotacticum MS-1]